MAEVFISYAHADRDLALLVDESLKRLDLDTWLDLDIKARDDFGERIQKELNLAQLVIAIWSPRAKASRWVKWESEQALHGDRLVSVFVGDVETSMPPPFSMDQAIDFTGWTGDTAADCYLDLLETIGDKLQRSDIADYAVYRRIKKRNPEVQSKRRLRHFTYRDMLALCDKIRDEVRSFDPEVMVCFDSRGGLWAEMFFSRLTYRIPVIVGFRLKRDGPRKSDMVFRDCDLIQTERWDLYLPPAVTSLPRNTKVLFVDDYSHIGDSSFRFKSHLPEAVKTLTLITSPGAAHKPDIFGMEEAAEIDLF